VVSKGNQTSKTKNVTVQKVSLDLFETLGVNLGTSMDYSSDIQFATDMFTGFKQMSFPRGTFREPVMYLWVWEPVPWTLRGIYVEEEIIID
jgi:hypothetical protein